MNFGSSCGGHLNDLSGHQLRFCASFAVALLLATAGALAQDLKVSASVDRTHLRIGENLVFTLRIQANDLAVTQPALPPLDGFKSVGTYQTLEASGAGRTLVFHYLLTPTRTGHIEVPALALRIGGQARELKGFSVDVETSVTSGFKPVEVRAPPAFPSAQDISFVGSLSSASAYVGQPVLYTLHLFTRRSIRALEMVKTPDFAGFRKVDDPQATGSPTHQVTMDGRVYLDAIVIRATLFPLQAGSLNVDPFTAQLKLEPAGAGGTYTLTGGKASLDVQPLPPAPPSYTGAVGSFSMKVTLPAPAKAEVGEPFSLSLLIEGFGFLPEQPLVWPDSPLFSPYATAIEDTSGFQGGAYRTRRLVKASFLPKVTGEAALPSATLVYFDPSARRYYFYELGGARIDVGGGGKPGGPEVRLAPIIESPSPGPFPRKPMPRDTFWLFLALPFLANLVLGLSLWAYRAFLVAPEVKRARALAYRARKSLRRARRNLDVRREQVFHEHLAQALTAALDLRVGRPTGGLSREQLAEALDEAGWSQNALAGAVSLSEEIERARYAPGRPTKKDLRQRYDAVAKWVR